MRWAPAAVILLAAAPAFGHGGRYVGPVPQRDPLLLRPTDWPYDGGSMVGVGPAPGARPSYVPGDSWRFAWHLLENRFIEERGGAVDGSVPAKAVTERILPALRTAAADSRLNVEIQGAALLGLVRSGDEGVRSLLRTDLTARGEGRPHRVVVGAAAVGLGLAAGASAEDAALLRSVASDPEARTEARALAVLGLSFLERGAPRPETLRVLERLLDRVRDDAGCRQDLPSAAALCLGRMESSSAAVLLARYLAPPIPGPPVEVDVTRCQAAAALGRAAGAVRDPVVAGMALSTLDAVLKEKGTLPAQGAVIGLGALGAAGDEGTAAACVARLTPILESDATEPMQRRFAALALARIAARAPSPARAAALEGVRKLVASGWPTPSWAALAAAVAGRNAPFEERAALAVGVRKLWEAGDPPNRTVRLEERGGCLIALGLLGDPSARPLLERILLDAEEGDDGRGYAAEVLGFLGDAAALPALRKTLAARYPRGPYRGAAVALGLLRDGESVADIIDKIRNPKSGEAILSACAQALGRIRDAGSVEPLLEILGNYEYPDVARAAATQALGRIASGSRPDPFADLSSFAPHRACSDSLVEIWNLF